MRDVMRITGHEPVLNGGLEARRNQLRTVLDSLDRLFELRREMQFGEIKEDALLLMIEYTVPCLLHLENRTREALLTRIVNNVFHRNFETGVIDTTLRAIEKIINTRGLGAVEGRIGQIKIRINAKGDGVETMSFNNYRIRMIMRLVATEIADVCYAAGDPKKVTLLKTMHDYEALIDLLREKEDLTDAQIDKVSRLSSSAFGSYIKTFEYEGLTNYWHIIGACHIIYYLKKYRSLSRYQNQGASD